jgi:superfamily II helicase
MEKRKKLKQIKTIIPHKCHYCNKNLWFDSLGKRNYYYFKGKYICNQCENKKFLKR